MQGGFTLVEVTVVLALLALAAAVVGPSLLWSHPETSAELPQLVRSVREAAVRCGQMVRLQIDRSGAWQAVAGIPPGNEVLMSGRLAGLSANPTDLIFSPIGTCGPGVASDPADALAAYDPLTCESHRR